ncbi:MAG: M48 family metallopeptidase [Bacteroidales bacterium]|nr:M48 family metallopeptidase [Bacteroidales bacterium]
MNAQIIFFLIVFLVLLNFLIEQYIAYLNRKNFSQLPPKLISDVYNEKEYIKNQSYLNENSKFSFVHSSFSLVILLFMLFYKGFAVLDTFLQTYNLSPVFLASIYLILLAVASAIINIPFSWQSTFSIEEKYGFNKTTKKIFVLDTIKSLFLTVIIGGLIIYLLSLLFYQFQTNFWLYAWAAITFFSIFMAMFYSNLIVPLFNKQKPLEKGELRDAIQSLSKKVGFKLNNIYVIDGSKRSTKANAYFAGFGPKKRIVLYDTLINDLSTEEIVAVLAHEIGHYKHKHVLKSMIISIFYTGLMLYIFSIFASKPVFSEALGVNQISLHIAIISFGILYSPISMLIGIIMNISSRKNEYEADNFAKNNYEAIHLISALKKLSQNSLSNLTPHRANVFINYSHPTLYQRIKALSDER